MTDNIKAFDSWIKCQDDNELLASWSLIFNDRQALQKRLEEREIELKSEVAMHDYTAGMLNDYIEKTKDIRNKNESTQDKLNKAIEVMKYLKRKLKESDPKIDFLVWFQESGLNMVKDFLKEVEK